MRRLDEIGALSRTTSVLLRHLEPRELAGRFVLQLCREFAAAAVLIRIDGIHERPILAAMRIEPELTPPLARDASDRLDAERSPVRLWYDDEVPGHDTWVAALAARPATDDDHDTRDLIVLFGDDHDSFDPEHDPPLLRTLAGHAAIAFGRARRFAEERRRAGRYAIRASQLQHLRDGLEDHVRSVERALAVRNRFLASVSHELRTPVNAILGYNQLLTEGVFGPLPPRQQEVVEKISASADQLLMLVKDVLDLSKIEAGKFAVERGTVDVARLVSDVVDALEGQARAKGLDLHVDCPPSLPMLETDTIRVRQILLNLLSNALKFTERGYVTVRARHIDPDVDSDAFAGDRAPGAPPGSDGWLAIEVEDTGIGIPREQIDAVFDEFVQVPTETARDGGGGSGLGLAISRRLARLLGGDIAVESSLGERSVFTLHLPCPTAEHTEDTTHDPDGVHE